MLSVTYIIYRTLQSMSYISIYYMLYISCSVLFIFYKRNVYIYIYLYLKENSDSFTLYEH